MATTKRKKNQESEWFGYRRVDPKTKTDKVLDVFDSVASRYDLMNDVMSGGIHRLWKKRFVALTRPSASKRLLDVAGGTGDIAFRYRARAGEKAKITVCDINEEMLKVGQARALDRGYVQGFNWIQGNAENLPFQDDNFDTYTIAFGLRNVAHIDDALEQAFRVLRPGGRFFCLEFSHVGNKALKKLYDEYSFRLIPRMGGMIAGDRESYQYLVESIRQFPSQLNLALRLEDAGFDRVSYTNLTGGIAAIHTGIKL